MKAFFARIRFRGAGTLIGPILISVVFASLSPTFLTAPNLLNVLQQSSINACIALGMTLVIISVAAIILIGRLGAAEPTMGTL